MSKLPETPKVLVADIDAATSGQIERMVSEAGFPVLIAADGAGAVRALVGHRPQIVILGKMPEADRPAIRDAIATLKDTHFTHVILLTAHSPRSRLMAAWEVGVDEFLSKPVKEYELLARLRSGVRALDLHKAIERCYRKGLFNWRRSRVHSSLTEMSNTDEQTGLRDLRYGLERLDEVWSLAQRHDHDLAVAIVDVDDFKKLNDTHGPEAGEAVLSQVGAALGRAVRELDVACRVGGQEFLLVFPDERSNDVLPALDRCRRGVEACVKPAPDVKVTISAGVAERTRGMRSLPDLLRAADTALFEAKAQGKNQIVVAEGGHPVSPTPARENAA
jgi:diguanylate cyclase (GGDEF)-like protein